MAESVVSPVLEIRGVKKSFREGGRTTAAVIDLTADVRAGLLTGLVGPDGAGKTTLIRLMAGLLHPDAGSVSFFGRPCSSLDSAGRARIGYMPQRFGLYEDLTVGENLDLFGKLHRLPQADFVARRRELLAFTGLSAFTDRLARNLSGGMKQKLGLACALMSDPPLLLLDEPSVGVDPISRRELWRLVDALRQRGTAIVWSTAYLDEAARCDRVMVLQDGRLVVADAPRTIIESAGIRAVLLDAIENPRSRQRMLLSDDRVLDAVLQGDGVRVVTARDSEIGDLGDAQPVPSRLEDAVVTLLRRNGRAVRSFALEARTTVGSSDTPAIAVEGLTRRFGNFLAVDGVSFEVARGEIFGLLGPNGAGKSTIFRMLCGLLKPSAGAARVAGIDLRAAPAEARQRIGYMAQRFSLYGDLTVKENLQFIAGTYGMDAKAFRMRLRQLAAALGLGEMLAVRCDSLSLGHKQRLSLAAAILHTPEILFLDEPTSGVDPIARREFWMNIGILADAGMTVLITSHFLDEAEGCDRVAIIDSGRLLALGTPATLRASCARDGLPAPTLDDAFIEIVQTSALRKSA